MDPIIISPTIQEWNGKRYYLCGRYFQRDGVRLHVIVWEAAHGKVPTGFHVHHKDHNRSRNMESNLELIGKVAHAKLHGSMLTEEQRQWKRDHIARVGVKSKKWHRSAEGKKWHSEHAKAQWDSRTLVKKPCSVCGTQYETPFPMRSKFCHQNCKAIDFRARHKLLQSDIKE